MFTANISSTSSSVDSSTDHLNEDNGRQLVNSNSPNNRLNMIISYGKELLCILAFILTTFASVQNNSPKVSRAVTPSPFFPRGSLVEDYYLGQLTPTQTKVSLSDLSLVLYYAPWCSESQHSREAFDHVARVFYREAYFSAINCWQPGSECRLQYSKIHSWPILMAYQRNGFGVQYQKNLWTEGALTKFVTSLLNPLQRLVTPDDLLESMTSKDAIIVAFIDIEKQPKKLRIYKRTALKFLERDPFNEIGFTIVTGQSTENFGVLQTPTIRAYMWNETLEFTGNFTSKEILRWVNEKLHQVSIQMSPTGTKSLTLSPYLNHGPVLVYFTPRNYYSEISDSYVMLQQIGMEYYNCKGDEWVQEMSRDYLHQRRRDNKNNQLNLYRECRDTFRQSFTENRECNSRVSVSFSNVLNASKSSVDRKVKNLPNFCGIDDVYDRCDCDESCGKLKYLPKMNKKVVQYETSMLDNNDDDRSPEALKRYNLRRKCEMLKIQERKSEAISIDDESSAPMQLISGMACKFNRSLSLLSMDSINFHAFAEKLGVNILDVENKTIAVILDNEFESTYILDEPINLNSLSRFIYAFHRGSLTRNIRSNNFDYKHTHFFDSNEFLTNKRKEKSVKKTIPTRKVCKEELNNLENRKHIVIKEINSDEFENEVIKSNKVKESKSKYSSKLIFNEFFPFRTDICSTFHFHQLCLLFSNVA